MSTKPNQSQNALALAALGVVFGDIGTSPLYAFQECVSKTHGVLPTPENVLGLVSLIFWSMTLVVTVKYLLFLLRADNHGEGGIMALLALVPEKLRQSAPGTVGLISLFVIAGAALLYGDGIITPAISVLSAVEGLKVASSELERYVVPITCAILVALFAIQRHGTHRIGALFGPVMLVWFLTLMGLGIYHLVQAPQVLAALSPHHAVEFFSRHGFHGARLLGSVVLVVTGGEALYADMGHFGRRPIQRAWIFVAFPALLLCYLGQASLLVRMPSASENLFYSMVEKGYRTYLLAALATGATIIASQALISGVFSLTHQAIRLGFFPRLTVRHTSDETEGQIYVPLINWGLMLSCITLVLAFQHSSKLAAAYGLAVSGTMGITSIIYFVVTRYNWGWPLWKSGGLLVLFLSLDIPFLGANLLKFFEGGWLPIFVGVIFAVVMITWRIGRSFLSEQLTKLTPPEESFLPGLPERLLGRLPGVAVFMSSFPRGVPPVLSRLVKRFRVAHETVLLLNVTTEHTPAVNESERYTVHAISQGFYRVTVRYGFIETYDIPSVIGRVMADIGCQTKPEEVLYMLGHETIMATERGKMGAVSESIFAFLSRNARNATNYFGIPPEQVVELGAQLDL